MHRFFVSPEQIRVEERTVTITGPDVNHIRNVLRMKAGEELDVADGQGGREYRCAVRGYGEDFVDCEFRFIREEGVELPSRIHLFQGLPKADKMELIIQKAVELGVYRILPVETKRCVVKLDDKKAKSKTARWQQISESAAKQSRRGIIPEVTQPLSFQKAVELAEGMDLKLIPYELAEGMEKTRRLLESVHSGQDIAVFIGPEGGFDEAEIRAAAEKGIEPITLGKRILRTETAPLAVLSWLMYRLEP